jgi:hypothetical protein
MIRWGGDVYVEQGRRKEGTENARWNSYMGPFHGRPIEERGEANR